MIFATLCAVDGPDKGGGVGKGEQEGMPLLRSSPGCVRAFCHVRAPPGGLTRRRANAGRSVSKSLCDGNWGCSSIVQKVSGAEGSLLQVFPVSDP